MSLWLEAQWVFIGWGGSAKEIHMSYRVCWKAFVSY